MINATITISKGKHKLNTPLAQNRLLSILQHSWSKEAQAIKSNKTDIRKWKVIRGHVKST